MDERATTPDARDLMDHAEFLRRLARRLLGDEHGAEDVVQDAMVVALESGHRRRGTAGAWLAGVVRNLSLLALRRRRRRKRRELLAESRRTQPGGVGSAERMEIARMVVDAVASLEEPYRSVIVLRYFDDLTPAEIASRLRCPAATVRTRLRRALAMLRARLGREHPDGWQLALVPFLRPAPAGPSILPAVFGGMLMKKVAVVLMLLILLLVGLRTLTDRASRDAPAGVADSAAGGEESREETSAPGPAKVVAAVESEGRPAPGISGVPPDDVAELTISGPEGKPLAGASVILYEDTPGRRLGIDMPPVRSRGLTDDMGRVRLSVTPVARHMAKISYPGLSTVVDVECFGGNVTQVTVPRGGTFTGVVTDADTGEPVVGAEVVVMDFAMCGLAHEWRVPTDGKGRYRVGGIAPGLLNIWATHPGYAEGFPGVPEARSVAGEETVLDIRLERGIRLTLRVTDRETGRILPEVEVVWARDPVARGRGDTLVTRPVPRDRGALELRAPGYLLEALDYVSRPPGRSQDPIEVRMTRGVPIRGAVLREDGTPAAGVSVRLLVMRKGQWGENWRSARTDFEGRFEVLGADPGGTVRMEVDLPDGGVRRGEEVTVAAGATEVVLDPLVLTPTSTIRGVLRDPEGRAFPRALVRAFPADGGVGPIAECFADPRGRFSLAGLPPGPLLLQAGCVTGWATQSCRVDLREKVMRMEWTFDRGLEVSGVLEREDGGRPAVATVFVGAGGYARTDEAGRFRVRGLGPGPFRVRLANRPDVSVEDVPGGTRNVRLVIPR